jgi:hypothetical protein
MSDLRASVDEGKFGVHLVEGFFATWIERLLWLVLAVDREVKPLSESAA